MKRQGASSGITLLLATPKLHVTLSLSLSLKTPRDFQTQNYGQLAILRWQPSHLILCSFLMPQGTTAKLYKEIHILIYKCREEEIALLYFSIFTPPKVDISICTFAHLSMEYI